MRSTRRDIFFSIGAFFQLILFSPVFGSPRVAISSDIDLAERCAALISSPEGAAAIGRVYLANVPEERNAHNLASRVLESLKRSSETHHGDWHRLSLRAKVSRTIRWEYEQGQVVVLDGWVLSRMEARLCAFLELNMRGPNAVGGIV